MKNELNAKFAANGGRARWKGKSAKERTEEMRRVAKAGWRKRKKRKADAIKFIDTFYADRK